MKTRTVLMLPIAVLLAVCLQTPVAAAETADPDGQTSLTAAAGPPAAEETLRAAADVVGQQPISAFMSEEETPDLAAIILQMAGSLAVIVALIFGVAWVYRKLNQTSMGRGSNGRFIQVLGSSFIGPKKSIYLVDVAGKVLVLGVTDAGMTTLATMNKDESARFLSQTTARDAHVPVFRGLLQKVMGKPAS